VLTRLSRLDLQFLAHLAVHPDWQILRDIFKRELAEYDAKCRTAPPTEVARYQGVASWLVDFDKTVSEARDKLLRTEPRASPPVRG
jgi:hypothetical protein